MKGLGLHLKCLSQRHTYLETDAQLVRVSTAGLKPKYAKTPHLADPPSPMRRFAQRHTCLGTDAIALGWPPTGG